jgi:hypothetical protein
VPGCTGTGTGIRMWQNELVSRFENAGETGEAGAVRVRVGERPHLHTVAIVVWASEYQNRSDTFHAVECENIEDACEHTCTILEESGFGSEFPNCRVDFLHADTGKPLRGWTATIPILGTSDAPSASPMEVLADLAIRSNAELRRVCSIMAETIQNREERIDQDRDDMIELSRQEVLARAEAELTQILAEEAAGTEAEVDPLKAHAGEILGAMAQRFLGGETSPRETVLAILRSDPGLTASLAGDAEVVGLFQDAIARAEEPAPEEPAPEEPAPEEPAPAPAPVVSDDGIPF